MTPVIRCVYLRPTVIRFPASLFVVAPVDAADVLSVLARLSSLRCTDVHLASTVVVYRELQYSHEHVVDTVVSKYWVQGIRYLRRQTHKIDARGWGEG